MDYLKHLKEVIDTAENLTKEMKREIKREKELTDATNHKRKVVLGEYILSNFNHHYENQHP